MIYKFFQSLSAEWPKLLATGILIPIIQWAANLAWQTRRKTRAMEIRRNIVDIEEFISKHRAAIGHDDNSINSSQAELTALVAKLETLSVPVSTIHPTLASTARFFLLYSPAYPISLIPRFLFFLEIAVIAVVFRRLIHGGNLRQFVLLMPSFLGLFLFHWITRRADAVTGAKVERPLWKRITLLYRPVSVVAGFCQAWAWGIVLYVPSVFVLNGADTDEIVDVPAFAYIVLGSVLITLWLLSRHLDRKTATPVVLPART